MKLHYVAVDSAINKEEKKKGKRFVNSRKFRRKQTWFRICCQQQPHATLGFAG
jgi:hypothetical protein